MRARRGVRDLLRLVLRRYGYEAVPASLLYEWQRHPETLPWCPGPSSVPAGAESYLRIDHPRLAELERRYADFDGRATKPFLWRPGHVEPRDILYFRGDTPYVWQLRGDNMNPVGYALAALSLESIDTLGLLQKLDEDEAFGAVTFTLAGKTISRDLLDSVGEISFLERHLELSSWPRGPRVLDIGAGYGRLAHRMVSALSNVRRYVCTDAVAVSTFVCEFYLRFRGVDDKAKTVPLDEIEEELRRHPPDIAVNVHSFSECDIEAVDWWVALLRASGVRYLMVIPNASHTGGRRLLTNDGADIQKVIHAHGYQLIVREPKYSDPVVQKYAINPTYRYLFQL